MITFFDPLIKYAFLHLGSPIDGKHPRWVCKIVDDWLDRYQHQHVHQPFLQAQNAGIGIARRYFPPLSQAEQITRWIEDEIAHTPIYPGLDWFRVFLFAAPESVPAALNAETLRYEWTGPRAAWPDQHQCFQAVVATEATDGVYAVVNGAGSTLRTVIRSTA